MAVMISLLYGSQRGYGGLVTLRFTPGLWWFRYFKVHTGATVIWLLHGSHRGYGGLVTLKFTPGLR